jgi:hypothetical protein
MATGDTFFESDGNSVTVDLLYTVEKGEIAVVDGWIGIAAGRGDSGEDIALTVDDREYQIEVPSTLDVAKGAILYIEVADVTGHTPDSTAYATSAGAGLVAFAKATSAKDANNVITAIMLGRGQLAS